MVAFCVNGSSQCFTRRFLAKAVIAAILLLLGGSAIAADPQLGPIEKWKPADPAFVPFNDFSASVSADNLYAAIIANAEKPGEGPPLPCQESRTYFLLNLTTGEHRALPAHHCWGVSASPSGHQFLIQGIDSTGPAMLVEGLELVRTFPLAANSFPEWNRNPATRAILFQTGWLLHAEGFNMLGILNVQSGKIKRIRLRTVTENFDTCPQNGHIFVEHGWNKGKTWVDGADEYDSQGHFLTTHPTSIGIPSSTCKYAASFSARSPHGPGSWAIYDTLQEKELIMFGWSETDESWFEEWNPLYDNLLLFSEQYEAGKQDNSAFSKLFDVSNRRVLQQWQDSAEKKPSGFSGDGRSLVFILDHHIVLDPIPADWLHK